MELCSDGTIILPLNGKRIKTIDYNYCLICQTKTSDDMVMASEQSFARYKEALVTRKENFDVVPDLFNLHEEHVTDEELRSRVKWHRNCYSSFTSNANIKRIKQRCQRQSSTVEVQDSNNSQSDQRLLRTTMGKIDINRCIFCQKRKRCKNSQEEKLVQVQSQNVAKQIREIALTNNVVKCRLGIADPIAATVKYHLSCLHKELYIEKKQDNANENSIYDKAFQELLKQTDLGFAKGHIYTLKTLCDLYNNILSSLGEESPHYPTQLVLKRITEHYGDKIDKATQIKKNESTLIFPKATATAAVQALYQNAQEQVDNGVIAPMSEENEDPLFTRMIYHVAEKIKSDLKKTKGLENITELTKEAAMRVVPDSLALLLNLILDDTNISQRENMVLNIGQDIVYAHNQRKLTPKHVAMGLVIHQATRSRLLVELVHAAGDCVSYDTIMRIDTTLASHLLKRYHNNNNVYIPENLQVEKFVHFATDNIDVIEETIDGKGTFHATQIVAFQRGPPKKNNESVVLQREKALKNIPLDFLETEQGSVISNPPIKVTPVSQSIFSKAEKQSSLHSRDITWLTCRSAKSSEQIIPSWTEANKVLSDKSHPVTTIGYTPIIPQPAHETDTLLSVLKRCKDISKALGQKHTVITCDEALYCKLKQIQWHGDAFDDVIIRLGGFHFVFNFMRVIGQHFSCSGLAEAWIETDIFGEKTALNIIEGKQYNRCIRALKLTCDALWRVLFKHIINWVNGTDKLPNECLGLIDSMDKFESSLELLSNWNILEAKAEVILNLVKEYDIHNDNNKLYKFWRSYLDLAGLVMKFVRAERQGDWNLHLEAVTQMLPWFFVYDHTNYARWGSVYLADMEALSKTAKEVYLEFINGNFVVKSTSKSFNEKSPDQALEHINKVHKIAGGLIGITKVDTARNRWCLTFNYRSYLSDMGRKLFGVQHEDSFDDCAHLFSMKKDETDVKKLCDFFQEKEVFDQNSKRLVNIFSGEVAPIEIENDLLAAQSRGLKLAEDFFTSRIVEKNVDFYSPLKKVKSKTFKHLHTIKVANKKTAKDMSVNTDVLVRQMFTAVKSGRHIDLNKILENELRHPPLSLFNNDGEPRQTPKALLVNQLQDKENTFDKIPNDSTQCATLVDGQALVQAIGKPKEAKTFGDLSDAFLRAIMSNYNKYNSQSIHVLFDRYNEISIKSGTRSKRCQSIVPVEYTISNRETLLPRNWDRFIHSIENKASLAQFLSKEIVEQSTKLGSSCELLTSGGFIEAEMVSTNLDRNVDHLKSNQEEADTRFVLHGRDTKLNGYDTLVVLSRDTDVLLLLIHYYQELPCTVWVKFGTSKKPKYIAVHDIARKMDPNMKTSLLSYHALTGCDSTSAFSGHTKKSSWKTFKKNHELLKDFGHSPDLSEEQIKNAEIFVIKMYGNKKPALETVTNINDLRASMFQHVKALDKLPPSKHVLELHIKRAGYQAFCWYTADLAIQTLPEPIDKGWKLEHGKLCPVTSLQEPITLKHLELISCNCKTGCRSSRCGCANRGQKCMDNICHIGV